MNILKELYKINKNTDCWEWKGTLINKGYGWLRCNKRRWLAHRLSYIINNGEIPKDKEILHICDNRKCINPKHLRLGTRKDNIQDMIKKGRMNKERPSKYYQYKGIRKGLKFWAEKFNINYATLNNRVNRLGWNIEKALEKNIRKYKKGE